MRSRRDLLFMPGDSEHKIQKAAGLAVDSIVMDLEDGVAWSRKGRRGPWCCRPCKPWILAAASGWCA